MLTHTTPPHICTLFITNLLWRESSQCAMHLLTQARRCPALVTKALMPIPNANLNQVGEATAVPPSTSDQRRRIPPPQLKSGRWVSTSSRQQGPLIRSVSIIACSIGGVMAETLRLKCGLPLHCRIHRNAQRGTSKKP
jgi:hypothetical protein